jgi:hypothetical protein
VTYKTQGQDAKRTSGLTAVTVSAVGSIPSKVRAREAAFAHVATRDEPNSEQWRHMNIVECSAYHSSKAIQNLRSSGWVSGSGAHNENVVVRSQLAARPTRSDVEDQMPGSISRLSPILKIPRACHLSAIAVILMVHSRPSPSPRAPHVYRAKLTHPHTPEYLDVRRGRR